MWTLESELCELAGQPSTDQALSALGLLKEGERLLSLQEIHGWRRAGAETYTYVFSVVSSSSGPKSLILKAYTAAPSGTGTLAEGLQQLLERRFLLMSHGVNTPRLYGTSRATWLEEYLEEDLRSALTDTSRAVSLCHGVLLYAVALDRLGFAPVGFAQDMRARGPEAVAVDFGQDIGPAGVSLDAERCQAEARTWLLKICRELDSETLLDLNAQAAARFITTLSNPPSS